ncbi:MAG TPA: SusC/RagA family TonB-linked outer membrane protein [Cyclobacteriaceae bacterium]
MLRKMISVCILALFMVIPLSAQDNVITGKVVDAENGEPLVGVSILITGTAQGSITDVDGNYRVTVPDDANSLTFSYVGYLPQRVQINGRSIIDVDLQLDVEELEEVVVVGYGTQRRRDVTSAISTIEAKDISKTPAPQAMQSLQGRVAGVQIVSQGAPGQGPTVRVRGIGSFEGNAAPLYVVDGMFFDNIDFLNPADIETLSVLKDASAAAIYGVRAGNGVVLIETKSGSYNQAPEIVYDGYYGIQNPQNVIQMSNTEQFVRYIDEVNDPADLSFIANASQRFGRSRVNPDLPVPNADWYAEIMEPAPIQNHSLSFNGGNQATRYSLGLNYFNQEGLLNDFARDQFKRINFRTKLDAVINNRLTVGGNLNVNFSRRYEANDAAWFNAYFAVPIMPKFDPLNTEAFPIQLSNAQTIGYRGAQNPFYNLLYQDTRFENSTVLGNFYAQVEIIPNKLSFKTQYNYSVENVNRRRVDFNYSNGNQEFQSGIGRDQRTSFDQVWDNYLTYNENFGKHDFTIVGGQSFRQEYTQLLFARGTEIVPDPSFDNEELWFISRALNIDIENVGDAEGNSFNINPDNFNLLYMSYFGRLSYSFDERYLFYATFRRDGNNKFQTKWNNFATIGAGWVLTEEEFFNVNGIDFLKIRGSWGQLGNDAIRPAAGAPTLDVARLTVINGAPVEGRVVNPVFDLIDEAETTVETNIGLTGRFLNNRLDVTADYYIRDTENLAITVIQPLIRENVRRSLGEIRNTGLEFTANWSGRINKDITYNVGGNFATLTNEVRGLGGAEFLNAGSAEFRQRSIVGQPFEAFFGYEINGVFQNQADIDNSGYTQEFIESAQLEPGDLFFTDRNGDGEINDEDRTVIGSYIPDVTYGVNLGVTWKNLEFSALLQGQAGHQILNRKRGEIIFTNDTNLDAELTTNLWRGEGTSNRYPSAAGLRKGWNQNMSEYYVEDGNFFRLQNVQIAYTFLDKELFGAQMPTTRFYFTAERPITVFDYNGFNPEVANGIDRQVYPIPAVYTLGLNVTL